MSDARDEAVRRYAVKPDSAGPFVQLKKVEATDDMLERALDTYADRIINIGDGLTAPEQRAEAMRAAIITAVGGQA